MQSGNDGQGSYYSSINQMWKKELKNKKKKKDRIDCQQQWYSKANEYWEKQQASYDGVLGGYGSVSKLDIDTSFKFIFQYFKAHPQHKRNRVIDCGAGIGRIAKQLLCQVYKTVDIIDQCTKYVEKAKQILNDKNIGHFYNKGLQQFQFQQKYDCIWIQWVISHLTQEDAQKFLKKAKQSLTQHGFILLKQNHATQGFIVDKNDYSVTRTKNIFANLFNKAQLNIIEEKIQQNWPKQLLQVRMYILQ